jgi:nucleoside-diphosphate-sugar epimerase
MTILVTGGAGFLGTRLIAHLLERQAGQAPVTRVLCVDRTASPLGDPRVHSVIGDLADATFGRAVVESDVTAIWHLAAVLSGQSEAEPELAMAVNVGGTQALLDGCRTLPQPPRFVFSSTVAVFGGPLPPVVPEDLALRPQSTYGASKAIAELLVLEASRRGVIDAVVCRVPTVSVRPGRPNSALSSFVSGIIREPLAGLESVCPVPLETPLWVSSPDTTTANLAHAGQLATSQLGEVRTVNLPGLTLTPAQMLDSLERVAGASARALVRVEPDPHIGRMVRSWPGAFDVTRARALGFTIDRDADALVAQFIANSTGASA